MWFIALGSGERVVHVEVCREKDWSRPVVITGNEALVSGLNIIPPRT